MKPLSRNWIVGQLSSIILVLYLTGHVYSYREIPSFGRDTIRRFSTNCSEMKKMAAHDFENLLQVRSLFR